MLFANKKNKPIESIHTTFGVILGGVIDEEIGLYSKLNDFTRILSLSDIGIFTLF